MTGQNNQIIVFMKMIKKLKQTFKKFFFTSKQKVSNQLNGLMEVLQKSIKSKIYLLNYTKNGLLLCNFQYVEVPECFISYLLNYKLCFNNFLQKLQYFSNLNQQFINKNNPKMQSTANHKALLKNNIKINPQQTHRKIITTEIIAAKLQIGCTNTEQQKNKQILRRKLAESIKQYQYNQCKMDLAKSVIFVGFPYDEGTRRNGGRVGGAVSSKIFRQTISQSDYYLNTSVQIFDAGQIEQDLILEKAHILHKEKMKQLLQLNQDKLIVSIGGSNDQSYFNVRALMEVYQNLKIGVVNIDAHFDVRPLNDGLAHSGSPFRQMLQDEYFKKNQSIFIQFANKGNTCSNDHFKYLKAHNVDVYWMQKDIRMFKLSQKSQYKTQAGQLFQQIVNELSRKVNKIFISFDTDSISNKWMPGVSAPNVTGGLTNIEAIEIMKITGKCQKLTLVDFSQMNPAVQKILSPRMVVEMFFSLVQSFGGR